MAWENLPSTNSPINATNLNKITDSGSNTNGNYIKFQDGTLIQWGRKNLPSVSFTQLTTGICYSAAQSITYPTAFIANPSSSVMSRTRNLSWIINVSSSTTALGFYVVNSNSGSTDADIEWMAVGRWQ